jgi:endonuclease/exonuclease/phosphatase family metal-dependent hydrolase
LRVLALILACMAFLYGENTLRIASYNVENLFDLYKGGYEYKEYIPYGKSRWNKENYRKKLKNIARVIADIDADIIALQEIESARALKDLKTAIKNAGVYYPYAKIANRKNTTIKVAILSKKPFVHNKEIEIDKTFRFRNILEVKFNIDGHELYIFNNHWKSKAGPESMRLKSALRLKQRIKQIGFDKYIILLGDFNSDYEEYKKFLRKRKHNDTNGKTGINHILNTLEQNKSSSKVTHAKNSFYNLWYDVEPEERFGYVYKGKKETLDNILISQSLLFNKHFHYIHQSMHSFRPTYLYKKNKVYRWQTSRGNPRIHRGKGYSDHLPLIAEFTISN